MKRIAIAQSLLKNSKQYGVKYEEFIQKYIDSFQTIKEQKETQDQEMGSLQNFDLCLSYLQVEIAKSNLTKFNGYGLFKMGYDMFCIANDKEKVALALIVFAGKVQVSCYGGTCPWEKA